jgi:crotonobetainyl-CoA:carnitine CoA-transferase CaiB-like acyl-CoA transferase
MAKVLDGITVVEFAAHLGSAYAAMLLAEFGARTIRIEPPEGDRTRGTPHFHVLNRSKQALFLDLDSPKEMATVRELLRIADVVVSGYTPARQRNLGLDYESIQRINPNALLLQMPALGSRGPYAEMAAEDDVVRAWSGIFGTQSSRSGNPVVTTFPLPSYQAGLLGAAAATAGLIARENGGGGQQIEVSLLSAALSMESGDFLRNPDLRTSRPGPADPLGPYPVIYLYKGSDGKYLIIDCPSRRFCERLAVALGQPELLADPRFKDAPWNVARAHVPALMDAIQGAFLTRTRDEWIAVLREHQVPAAPVLDREQFFADPQVRHLRLRRELDDPQLGHTLQMGVPIRLSATPGEIVGPAPAINRNNPLLGDLLAEARRENGGGTGASAPTAKSRGPLDGVTVIDFSSYIAGSFGPMLLAHLGADVIKIEGRDGDSLRHVSGFRSWNQNKLGLGVDIKTAQGREIVYELVRKADVFVENFRPGRTRALGIDYERLSAINPRLIYMSVTGFGSNGPDYDRPGLDPLAQAISGTMAAHSGAGLPPDSNHDSPRHPLYMTLPICDYGAATLSALGCILALRARQVTGRGQLCETSLIDAALALQPGEFVFYPGRPNLENGAPESRGNSALRRVYQCQDGKWLYLAISDATAWNALRAQLPPVGSTSFEQAQKEGPEGALAQTLAGYFAARPSPQLFEMLYARAIPITHAPHISELFEDPQVIANELAVVVNETALGAVLQPSSYARFSNAGAAIRPAPRIGEHSEQVLARFLGYDAGRIASLREAGVIFSV